LDDEEEEEARITKCRTHMDKNDNFMFFCFFLHAHDFLNKSFKKYFPTKQK